MRSTLALSLLLLAAPAFAEAPKPAMPQRVEAEYTGSIASVTTVLAIIGRHVSPVA